MKLLNCFEAAVTVAVKNRVEIAIVHDPITNAEEDGDYNYCPPSAVSILFRHGEITHRVSPTGEITELGRTVHLDLPQDHLMHERHLQHADLCVYHILRQLAEREETPSQLTLAKFESQEDYEALRPEDQPSDPDAPRVRFEEQARMIDYVASSLAARPELEGVNIKIPLINQRHYLAWLDATGRTNDPESRALFIAYPVTEA